MENRIKGLKEKIFEMEENLIFINKYQIPFSFSGQLILVEEIKNWKIELAELEAKESRRFTILLLSN